MFPKDIMCALSGGGFRATFLHAGVLRRLVAMGLKDNIKVISSVSGGSITSALFGLQFDHIASVADFDRLVLSPLVDFSKRNPRNAILSLKFESLIQSTLSGIGSLLGPLGLPFSIFATKQNSEHFMHHLDKHLFEGKTLGDLSKNVRVVLNATNLNNGARFRFDNTDFGDYKIGYSYELDHLPVSFAVTASACFPGLFAPIKMDIRNYKFIKRDQYKNDATSPSTAPDFINLSDGGIYDNLGYFSIEAEIKRGACGFVVISDAANRFNTNNRNYGFFSSIFRIKDILMEQISNRDRKKIVDNLLDDTWTGIYFKLENSCRWYRELKHNKCVPADLVPVMGWTDSTVRSIAQIRTDLNFFTDIEIKSLVNHGETLVETTFAKWHNADYRKIQQSSAYIPITTPETTDKEIVDVLKHSHKRFGNIL